LNSLRNACNQSTSRDPVVDYSDHDVQQALTSLRERSLTRTVHSTSNRAMKFRHVMPDVLDLAPDETALLAVLLLRGAQTVGELKTRSERQHHFASTDAVEIALTRLADRQLTLRLDRQPGQKDARWVHLLAPVDATTSMAAVGSSLADVSSSDDPYGQATAEFYDLLATDHWDAFGFQLIDLLAGVDPTAGPILDLGSGTGVGLPYLQAAVPGARIRAIEPSKAMRTGLHARLANDETLRRVTTVDPRSLAEADLPDRACAVVMSAVLGHLTEAERDLLWRYVAARLPAGAPTVVEVLPPRRPLSVPPTRYRRLDVGEFVYEGWQEGEPADDRHMAWTMTYKVLDGDTDIASYQVRSLWRCFDPSDLRDEVAPYGLAVAEHDDCVVISRPA
jgi:uncharacterized protein YceH (UPF0502 family)